MAKKKSKKRRQKEIKKKVEQNRLTSLYSTPEKTEPEINEKIVEEEENQVIELIEAAKIELSIPQILEELSYNQGYLPASALQAAIEKKEQITPELLNILKETIINPEDIDDDYMAHIYAMFLLAQFRETRALPLLIDLFSLPDDIRDAITGDILTEDLGKLFASVCGGDTSVLNEIIEDPDQDEYVRSAALESYLILYAIGERSRESVMNYFQSLFQGKLEPEPSLVWDCLVKYATDLYPEEVLDEIRRAYEEDLVDSFFVEESEVDEALTMGKEATLKNRINSQLRTIDDSISELEKWACFRKGWDDFGDILENMTKNKKQKKKKRKIAKTSRKKNRRKK